MGAEARLKELGLDLPEPMPPAGLYAGATTVDKMVFVAGHGPVGSKGEIVTGKVPSERSVDEAVAAARLTALSALASLRAEIGDLDRVDRVVKIFGMVNADPDFKEHPKVIDGFSQLMIDVFGEAGRASRSAVGLGSLPFQISVEVEMVVTLK